MQQVKNEVVSVRFTTKHAKLLKNIANEQNISLSKLVEIISTNHVDVLGKCFKRQDIIMQREEIRKLYDNFSEDQLDKWIEDKFPKTLSCMKLFASIMEFNEISNVWMDWFKLNNHYLFYEDRNGWRTWRCNTDMGYNWLYVNGKIYLKMFESIGCQV